jgi:hypothetical protein
MPNLPLGDLVYLNILGTSYLYVHSAEMAYELFVKKSAIYSDRPIVPMIDLYALFCYNLIRKRVICSLFFQCGVVLGSQLDALWRKLATASICFSSEVEQHFTGPVHSSPSQACTVSHIFVY